jgi:hypothetical protein
LYVAVNGAEVEFDQARALQHMTLKPNSVPPITGALWRVDRISGQLITRSPTVIDWRAADAIIGL